MKIHANQLNEGDNFLEFSEKDASVREVAEALQKESVRVQAPVQVRLHLTKLEPDYYLKGVLEYGIRQACARCAEPFEMKIRHPFEVALSQKSGAEKESDELSFDSEEPDVMFFSGNEIDLGPLLQEQFVLGVPYRSLCADECRGLCQGCGKNLNQGPCGCNKVSVSEGPFAVLQQLKKK